MYSKYMSCTWITGWCRIEQPSCLGSLDLIWSILTKMLLEVNIKIRWGVRKFCFPKFIHRSALHQMFAASHEI